MKLLLATPTNMVLEDPTVGQSLIGVFNEIKIQIASDSPEIAANIMLPKEWAVFWRFGLEPEEEGKEYSLVIEMRWPDGAILGLQTLSAVQPTKNGMSFVAKLQAFPMGQNGTFRVSAKLTSNAELVCGPIETEIKVSLERSLSPSGGVKDEKPT